VSGNAVHSASAVFFDGNGKVFTEEQKKEQS
jgi:hypothetical protein